MMIHESSEMFRKLKCLKDSFGEWHNRRRVKYLKLVTWKFIII